MPWSQDLESQASCASRLGGVIRHQTAYPELFHGRQVEPVQRATVGLPAALMLAKSGLKNLSWQGQEAERIELAELLQLAQLGAIATLPEHRTQPSGP
jgi:hypothetical protein